MPKRHGTDQLFLLPALLRVAGAAGAGGGCQGERLPGAPHCAALPRAGIGGKRNCSQTADGVPLKGTMRSLAHVVMHSTSRSGHV